jgi:protein SCO1/2
MTPTAARPLSKGDTTKIWNRRIYLGIAMLLVATLVLGTAALFWLSDNGTGQLAIGGPFTLLDGDGRTVTDRYFHGSYMLVYFGYTFCPDVCPMTLNEVADAMERLGSKADKVHPVFITVDPRRDTPAVVKQYASAFSPRLIGLTGAQEQIAKVAQEYRVYYAEHRTGPGPDDYSMDHSSILYLMGTDGSFIAPIGTGESGQAIADEITRFVR